MAAIEPLSTSRRRPVEGASAGSASGRAGRFRGRDGLVLVLYFRPGGLLGHNELVVGRDTPGARFDDKDNAARRDQG